jgi:C_GCAxxG_C_C family probable redox protein
VLLAVCQEFEMEMGSGVIPQIASAFAGGIGNTGAVCGAVVGAVMAIGLKQGRGETMEEMLGKLAVAREFRRRFEAEMGEIGCRELTGLDLSTEEGLRQAMSDDTPQRVCVPAVAASYRLAVGLLQETL